MVKNAKKLITDVNSKIAKWNERSCFTLKGVKNLSRSDMDVIKLYAETIQKYGNCSSLMRPVGGVKEVLTAYGLLEGGYQ